MTTIDLLFGQTENDDVLVITRDGSNAWQRIPAGSNPQPGDMIRLPWGAVQEVCSPLNRRTRFVEMAFAERVEETRMESAMMNGCD